MFLPFISVERLFWLYILTFILIAFVIFLKKNHTISGFISFLLPKEVYRHQSSKIDVLILMLNPFVSIFLIIPTTILASFLTAQFFVMLLDMLFTSPILELSSYSYVIYSVIWIIAYDFAQYIAHYWQHKNPILWEFHKIHHSAEVLNPATAYRFHPLDTCIVNFIICLFTGIVTALFTWLYHYELSLLSILNMHFIIFLFYLCGYNFRHSHIKLIYPRWLQYILVCPSQHQIHHSIEAKHWDKNIGYIFSFWDWLFGTLYIATHDEEYQFGLSKNQDSTYRSLYNVYITPFKNIRNILKKS